MVFSRSGKQNTVTVSGTGSVMNLTSVGGAAWVGRDSTDNTLIVENNGLIDGGNNFIIGEKESSTGNVVSILSGGRINGTNFDLRRGTATITNGSLYLKQFFSTTMMAFVGGKVISNVDPASTITFNSGMIEAVGADVANGSAFTVGDGGADSATYHMRKDVVGARGTHTFANGLVLSATGILSGDGDIVGNVSGSAGGQVQVGASPGVINVTGDWNNTGLGISLEVDNLSLSVVPGDQFDQLDITGLFTHGGSVTIDRSQLVAASMRNSSGSSAGIPKPAPRPQRPSRS